MANPNSKVRLLAGIVMLFAAVFLSAGCSESPLDPNQSASTQPTLLQRASRSSDGASMAPVNLHIANTISATTGGVLTLLDVVLVVPPGAVDNDTTFSIDIPDDEIFFNEFGADGLVFNVPVTVTMSYRDADLIGVDESTIRIGWLNEATGQFENVDCEVNRLTKTVTAKLNHFSAYGLISD